MKVVYRQIPVEDDGGKQQHSTSLNPANAISQCIARTNPRNHTNTNLDKFVRRLVLLVAGLHPMAVVFAFAVDMMSKPNAKILSK